MSNLHYLSSSDINPKFKPLYTASSKKQIFAICGGAGSGKSHAVAQYIATLLSAYVGITKWVEAHQKRMGEKPFLQWIGYHKWSVRDKELFNKPNGLPAVVAYQKEKKDTCNIVVSDKEAGLRVLQQKKLLNPTNVVEEPERIVLVRKTKSICKDSSFSTTRKYASGLDSLNVNNHALRMCTVDSATKKEEVQHELLCLGFRDKGIEEGLKSFDGITCFWVEEALEGLTYAEFTELMRRLRSNTSKRMRVILTYNPVNKEHWINQYFHLFQNPDTSEPLDTVDLAYLEEKSVVINSTYLDNRFLPQSFKTNLEMLKRTNPQAYRIYTEGEWGGGRSGLVYNNWEKVADFPPFMDYWYYGGDYGFMHAYGLVKVFFLPENQVDSNGFEWEKGLYVQEIAYEKQTLTNAMISRYKPKMLDGSTLFFSPERPDARKEWADAGFWVHGGNMSQKGDVLAGISWLNKHKIFVVSNPENLSLNFMTELGEYGWKRGVKEEPDKNNDMDNLMDSMRYGVLQYRKLYP